MSKIRITADVDLWTEGDRINVGISGENISGTQRLSTRLETETGKQLARTLHLTQIEHWAGILSSNGSFRVKAEHAKLYTLDAFDDRMSVLSARDGLLRAELMEESLRAGLSLVHQIVMLKDVGYVDAWKDLEVTSSSALVKDLLRVAFFNSGRDFLGNYPESVRVEDLADVRLGTPGRPFIIVRSLHNADSYGAGRLIRLMDILDSLPTQNGYPVIIELDGSTHLRNSITSRAVFFVSKNYDPREFASHYRITSPESSARAHFTQIHGRDEERGQILRIELRDVHDAATGEPITSLMVDRRKHGIEAILNALESSQQRPAPVVLVRAEPEEISPQEHEVEQLKALMSDFFYGQDPTVARVAELLVQQGYRKD